MRKNRTKTDVNKKRWAAYAAAGVAATLGGTQSAEADITDVRPGVQLIDDAPGDGYFGTPYAATFGGGAASLAFNHGFSETAPGDGQLILLGAGNMEIAGQAAGAYFYPSNLAYGQNISTLDFFAAEGNRGDMAWGGGYSNSQFIDAGGYVAFRYDVGNGTEYGWAELTLDQGAPANIFTLAAMSYGTDDTGGLRVGQTGAIPEPGSLGLLAMGAAGLATWRRRRKAA